MNKLTEEFTDEDMIDSLTARKLLINLFDELNLGFSKDEKKEMASTFVKQEKISKQTFKTLILSSIPQGE